MKKILSFISFPFFLTTCAFAATQSNDQNAAYDEARQDYRAYLQQLKVLNQQYKEITGEMSKIIKEEGVPGWDMGGAGLEPTQDQANGKTFAAADIQETDKDIVVKMDLPGVNKDKIKLKIENNKMLHVQGERDEEKQETQTTPDTRYQRTERQHGVFERVIELPALASDSGTEAKYENGVLTVTIPKAKEAKKEVAVSVE